MNDKGEHICTRERISIPFQDKKKVEKCQEKWQQNVVETIIGWRIEQRWTENQQKCKITNNLIRSIESKEKNTFKWTKII